MNFPCGTSWLSLLTGLAHGLIRLVCLQSFFSWHVEDVDLYSTNYLHFGAPKVSSKTIIALGRSQFLPLYVSACMLDVMVWRSCCQSPLQVWYCVSPKDRPKFENMAKNMFPELHRICPAFMRHKDILFSPKMLRSYGVDYLQVGWCR